MKKLLIAAALMLLTFPVFAEKVTVTVSNMHCQNCANRVESVLRADKGVKSVTVNLETKEVTVDFDEKATSAKKVKKRLTKANFKLGKDKAGKSCGKCQKQGGCQKQGNC